jgi:pyruvate/2-oxoglutarate dehydrogenase complex dihydrolipoamide acyltransferase (E2) component
MINKLHQMECFLSYDHRVVNGADGARFVAKLGSMLNDFFALLAEA